MNPPTPTIDALLHGRIDIHSHLLTDVDDGCANFDKVSQSVDQLISFGYVGSICTFHINPHVFLRNTPVLLESLTEQLSGQLKQAGVSYRVWSGGELTLFDGVIDCLKHHGVPTLVESRCVITDFRKGD